MKSWLKTIAILPVVMLTATLSLASPSHLHSDTTSILNRLLNGSDNRVRPLYGGEPTVVQTDINVRSMGPISEIDMSYSMDAYFRQRWTDERLKFNGSLPEMTVNIKVLEKIWKPDTFFYNGQGSYLHDATVPNKLLRIRQTGDILYSMRLTIKAKCPMHLEYFPMDQQSCPLVIGSFAYRSDQIIYKWTLGPQNSTKIAKDVRLSQYDLLGQKAEEAVITRNNTEQFSVLMVNFTLKRHMGYYLLQVYLPCNMIVVISWLSFWIPRETTADRVGLGVTAVLTLTTLGMDARSDLPKVPYATALDVYLVMCYLFVVATLIQFAAVHYFTKRNFGDFAFDDNRSSSESEEEDNDELERIPDHAIKNNICHLASNNSDHQTNNIIIAESDGHIKCIKRVHPKTKNEEKLYETTKRRSSSINNHDYQLPHYSCFRKFLFCLIGSTSYQNTVRRVVSRGTRGIRDVNSVSMIDKVSRVLFPLTYLILNVIYWISYLRKFHF